MKKERLNCPPWSCLAAARAVTTRGFEGGVTACFEGQAPNRPPGQESSPNRAPGERQPGPGIPIREPD